MFAIEGLRDLDVSGNSLTGEIPDLSSLVELESLGLAKNKLKGSIPESIGHARALRFLDVSFTPLTGKLPTSLQNLTHLEEMKIQMTNLDLGDLGGCCERNALLKCCTIMM
jgi:Leucine-rich repeat (LRR) protein